LRQQAGIYSSPGFLAWKTVWLASAGFIGTSPRVFRNTGLTHELPVQDAGRAERPGQWVAYRGEHLVDFAVHQHELYHQCFAQGLTREEIVVFCIEPLETEMFLSSDIRD